MGALSSTYNNQVRVSGYGQDYIGGGGSNITTDYVLTDPAKDGNTYAQTDYQFFRICSPGDEEATWCSDGYRSTPEIRVPQHPRDLRHERIVHDKHPAPR